MRPGMEWMERSSGAARPGALMPTAESVRVWDSSWARRSRTRSCQSGRPSRDSPSLVGAVASAMRVPSDEKTAALMAVPPRSMPAKRGSMRGLMKREGGRVVNLIFLWGGRGTGWGCCGEGPAEAGRVMLRCGGDKAGTALLRGHALVAGISQTLPGTEGSGEWAGGCSPTTGCGGEGCGCGQEGGRGFGDGVAVLDVVDAEIEVIPALDGPDTLRGINPYKLVVSPLQDVTIACD